MLGGNLSSPVWPVSSTSSFLSTCSKLSKTELGECFQFVLLHEGRRHDCPLGCLLVDVIRWLPYIALSILWTCLHLTKFELKSFVLWEPDKTWALPGAVNTVSVSTRCQMLAILSYKVSQSLCFKRVAGGWWTRNNKHLLLKRFFKTV